VGVAVVPCLNGQNTAGAYNAGVAAAWLNATQSGEAASREKTDIVREFSPDCEKILTCGGRHYYAYPK
jgi:hypothetical protein